MVYHFICICRFERDVWAAGDWTDSAGESIQLPDSRGKNGESVHHPECGPGQRGKLLCCQLHQHAYVLIVTYTHHTHSKKIKGHCFHLTYSSGCRLSCISMLHEKLFIIDKPYSFWKFQCRSYFRVYWVHRESSHIRDAANMGHLSNSTRRACWCNVGLCSILLNQIYCIAMLGIYFLNFGNIWKILLFMFGCFFQWFSYFWGRFLYIYKK